MEWPFINEQSFPLKTIIKQLNNGNGTISVHKIVQTYKYLYANAKRKYF